MTKILVLGDTHGDVRAVSIAASFAKTRGCSRIYVVGDFGFIWTGRNNTGQINEILKQDGVCLYAIAGNHEDHPLWNRLVHKYELPGIPAYSYISSNIALFKRTVTFKLDGKTFGIAAGAASVDRQWRKAGVDWFPEEQLTDAEVEAFPEGHVDYLFTHDCSNATPWGFNIIVDPDSEIHRRKIDTILKKTTPKMHFHGHMHRRYEWVNRTGGNDWTDTYGLDCNGSKWNMLVLDTDTDSVQWIDKGWK
jgi:predicted phosphodiesterase